MYLTLHHSTLALLHSTWLYITLLWLYFTLLNSTLLSYGSTSLHLTLHYPCLCFTLPDSAILCSYTSLYLTLHSSIMGLLHCTWRSTLLYIDSTSLYLSLHYSTLPLLHSISFCITLLWLYDIPLTLHFSTMALFHPTWLYFTLP